jgi:hypothetical protein
MTPADKVIWILTFALIAVMGVAIASVTGELRRLRRQRERHEASATERHALELAHLSAIRVAIVGHGAVIGQALETAADSVRDTPVMPPPDEIPERARLVPPMPHVDLQPDLPAPPDGTASPDGATDDGLDAPPDVTDSAEGSTDEDAVPTSTFNRAHLPRPNMDSAS